MKKQRVSKERKEIEEDLLFHLRNYWGLRGAHHEQLDKYIDYLVELLKNKQN